MKIFLNDKLVKGLIILEYVTFHRYVELINLSDIKEYEADPTKCNLECHRDLIRVTSDHLIELVDRKAGVWEGVTSIKFFTNTTSVSYEAYKKRKIVLMRMIPTVNVMELTVYSPSGGKAPTKIGDYDQSVIEELK